LYPAQTRSSRGAEGFLNLTLVLDEDNGNTLVDTGLPGQHVGVARILRRVGLLHTPKEVTHILTSAPNGGGAAV
jgi:glyoxylase-like metal-dependent hydrolase (beta-lactamase superfamily II)